MKIILSILTLLIALNLFASDLIEIQNPIIRLTPPGSSVTALFLKIINHTNNDLRLVMVKGDFAGSFELHKMEMLNGAMRMRRVDFIEIKKNSTTVLQSGGYHIMIFDLKRPLNIGDLLGLKLILDNREKVEINAKVEKLD